MIRKLLLLFSHVAVFAAGVALGIYLLPILIAPSSPTAAEVKSASTGAQFSGRFRRDLKDSDPLHWGEGEVSVGAQAVAFTGKLAPGPDYKLYLSPGFVETETEFARLKPRMKRLGDVKTFDSFVVAVPPEVDVARYDTVIVWCETFSQFITAAKYR